MGLSDGVHFTILLSLCYAQYQRVTDRQTDGRTRKRHIISDCVCSRHMLRLNVWWTTSVHDCWCFGVARTLQCTLVELARMHACGSAIVTCMLLYFRFLFNLSCGTSLLMQGVLYYTKWKRGSLVQFHSYLYCMYISLQSICKQPWASCWPTVCSGQLSLLPFAGWEMSSSLQATGWRPSVADWGSGMSTCWTAGPVVR